MSSVVCMFAAGEETSADILNISVIEITKIMVRGKYTDDSIQKTCTIDPDIAHCIHILRNMEHISEFHHMSDPVWPNQRTKTQFNNDNEFLQSIKSGYEFMIRRMWTGIIYSNRGEIYTSPVLTKDEEKYVYNVLIHMSKSVPLYQEFIARGTIDSLSSLQLRYIMITSSRAEFSDRERLMMEEQLEFNLIQDFEATDSSK